MTVQSDGTVRYEVTVDLLPEQAFWKLADFDRIKPRELNMLAVPIAETVLEQRAGGDVYDRGIDRASCRWGRVPTFDPPRMIAFSWDAGPDWQVTSHLDQASQVEVTSAAEGREGTGVISVHRPQDRQAERCKSPQAGLDASDGWPLYLGRYLALTRDEMAP